MQIHMRGTVCTITELCLVHQCNVSLSTSNFILVAWKILGHTHIYVTQHVDILYKAANAFFGANLKLVVIRMNFKLF